MLEDGGIRTAHLGDRAGESFVRVADSIGMVLLDTPDPGVFQLLTDFVE